MCAVSAAPMFLAASRLPIPAQDILLGVRSPRWLRPWFDSRFSESIFSLDRFEYFRTYRDAWKDFFPGQDPIVSSKARSSY